MEREFVAALSRVLDELRPAQLDPGETAMTAEGGRCLILLMPHRALGGVSVVVWLSDEDVSVAWAQVAALGCCHDSLDAGVWVGRFRVDPAAPSFVAALDCIREQLSKPLFLVVYGTTGVVRVPDLKGVFRTVGEIGPQRPSWRSLWPGRPSQVADVRFTDPAAPPVAAPSGVDEWFTTGGHRRWGG